MRRRLLRLKLWPALYAILAAFGVVQLYRPEIALGSAPDPFTDGLGSLGRPSVGAFGRSGSVKLLFALPGQAVDFPVEIEGDPRGVMYEWTSLRGVESGVAPQPVEGARLLVPATPGFYRLTLVRGDTKQIFNEPTVAVMRPFQDKSGTMLNGYRIGTYRAEKLRGKRTNERPDGFLEVYPQHIDIALSKHFRVSDFVTHDNQAHVWPKYVALSPRLLDKLELVFAQLEQRRGDSVARRDLRLDVRSGFRTPSYNKRVRRAARDSRHQYGDAADVGVDANWNGRFDRGDWRVLVSAVDAVERSYPDLVGGLGIYNSRRYAAPYVHIDVRGKRSRWRG